MHDSPSLRVLKDDREQTTCVLNDHVL